MQATELAVVVLRWRAVGSRCVFVDALGDDGELQLCFADGQLAADELSAGARLRVTARPEPLPTRRGLAAYACAELLELTSNAKIDTQSKFRGVASQKNFFENLRMRKILDLSTLVVTKHHFSKPHITLSKIPWYFYKS